MKKAPSIVTVNTVVHTVNNISARINGQWVPARAMGMYGLLPRLKAAWGVFTGKYDALVWPEGQ